VQLGIIGLGKMGGNLALQAHEKGIDVVGMSRSAKPDLERQGLYIAKDLHSLADRLRAPRVVYLSLPAGPTVDTVLEDLGKHLHNGDVVMDGGNSMYLDSIEREKRMEGKGIH
jgi:6-phosphogluconate dehydrogenase